MIHFKYVPRSFTTKMRASYRVITEFAVKVEIRIFRCNLFLCRPNGSVCLCAVRKSQQESNGAISILQIERLFSKQFDLSNVFNPLYTSYRRLNLRRLSRSY